MDKLTALRESALKKINLDIKKQLVESNFLIKKRISIIIVLNSFFNSLFEKLREAYSYYFPELGEIIRSNEDYLKLVNKLRERSNFTKQNIKKIVGFKPYLLDLEKTACSSRGLEFEEKDFETIDSLIFLINEVKKIKNKEEEILKKEMKEKMPNLEYLLGSTIATKLILEAGSLEELAKMPASRIQILGVQDKVYSSIRDKQNPPRFGIIFQYPNIRGAPNKKRGKIARKLANKIAIAAKQDFFNGNFVGDKLKRKIDEEIKHIL